MKYDFAKVCQELWGLIDLAPSLYLSQKCWRVCSHYTHAWQPDDVKSLCKQASGTYPVSRVSETKWHKHRRHIHCHALLKLALFSCLACTDFFGNCCPKCESLAVTVQVHTGPFSILATTHQVFAQQGLADDKKACRLNYIHLPTDRTACSACNPILVPHLCTLFHSSSSWSNLAFASSQLDKWYITALKSCIDPASGIVLVPVVSNGHSWNFYQLSSLVLSIIQHICYFLDFGGGMNANEIQMRPQISLLFAAFFSLNWLELVEWWTIWSNNPIRFSFVRQTLETRPFRNLHSPLPHRAFTAHSNWFQIDFSYVQTRSAIFKISGKAAAWTYGPAGCENTGATACILCHLPTVFHEVLTFTLRQPRMEMDEYFFRLSWFDSFDIKRSCKEEADMTPSWVLKVLQGTFFVLWAHRNAKPQPAGCFEKRLTRPSGVALHNLRTFGVPVDDNRSLLDLHMPQNPGIQSQLQ